MRGEFLVLDSDFHMMEPDDLWDRYLEVEWKPVAPRFSRNESFPNKDSLIVQGKAIPPVAASNDLSVAGVSRTLDRRASEASTHYQFARDRGFDPATHLMGMDIEGIDVGVLYATRGRHVIAVDDIDPFYAAALCRAYNNWSYDYCQADPSRMKIAAVVPFHDGELAAAEARRAVTELGAVAIDVQPTPVSGNFLHDPSFEPFWAEVEHWGVPVGFHPVGSGALKEAVGLRFVGHPAYYPIGHALNNPVTNMAAFAMLAMGGVFERHPNLTVAFLESTCGWLPWWLERLDEQWEKFGPECGVKLSAKPSEYFFRHCYIATDTDEEGLGVVIDQIGDDRIVVSTDYPHADGLFPHATETFLGLEGVSAESKRKILWDNCARLYKLSAPSRVEAASNLTSLTNP
jgi:predicted TIM-barrel fold metal-dependent hydrolase